MLERIARTCFRRRRLVVVGWIVLLVGMSAIGSTFGGESRTDFSLPGAESQEAGDLLEEAGFGGRAGHTGQIVVAADQGVDDPAVKEALERLFADVTAEVDGVAVVSPYEPEGAAQVNQDRTVAFGEVELDAEELEEALVLADEVAAVRDDAELPAGVRVELGGELFYEESEFSSEAFGLLAAVVILLVAFGSVLAMGLPIVTALFGIGCGFALVQLASNVMDVPEFAPAAVAMIAIGVGIDYALFIVTRYREELAAGRDPEAAVARAFDTAGRAVLFAGTTVVISLLGLLLVGMASTRSLAVAASAGVLMVMLASLTLLPALLGFAGRTIDRFGLPHRKAATSDDGGSFWRRWSRFVQRRPWPVAIVGLVVLLALAAPVVSMRLGFGDAGNRPTTDTARRAYDTISGGFGPGYNGPLFLAADLTGDPETDQAVLERLRDDVEADPGVAFATPAIPGEDGKVAFLQVFPTTAPQDEATSDLVHRIRDDIVPSAVADTGADVLVGGVVAGAIDFSDVQRSRLPLFIGAVLLLSFLLLMAVFRSVLVPLKAVVMNLLSIGAAYGVVVAVFQWGWGADLLGVGEPGPVEAWAPMMLFAIVFGLSMDYEVFLLSRIKEEYERTGDNATAVADGLARTARLITAAAAIMLFVFGGFVLSVDRALQLFGLGLAVAVFIDATVVRMLLVPATMELLGDRNWWLPRWLDRLLPELRVEGAPAEAPTPAADLVPSAGS
jgi:RND superfamily putative drug exporter